MRGAPTVTGLTRGYDAGKRVSGRKTFGVVDSIGLLIAVVVGVYATKLGWRARSRTVGVVSHSTPV